MSAAPWVIAPLALQAVAMGFDELHFHRKRGLDRWERVGHPLDTLTLLACVAWALAFPPSARNLAVFLGLAALSCLFITKDEIVHARHCEPAEHWIDALLFVLHPLVLLGVALLWPSLYPAGARVYPGIGDMAFARAVLLTFLAGAGTFCCYQAGYWNGPWAKTAADGNRSVQSARNVPTTADGTHG